jgi:exosortase/archaeosortase family protein
MLSTLLSMKQKWLEIPKTIKSMLILGAILLVTWKTLYTFWLEPKRILDAPMTELVALHTVRVMEYLWPSGNYEIKDIVRTHKADKEATVTHIFILKDNQPTISIADNCNGVELMVLFAAFIACMPGRWPRKIAFILFGIPLLHVANLARCIGLVGLHLQWPGMFDFAHHYLFKIMVYAITFLLWVWYLRPYTPSKK